MDWFVYIVECKDKTFYTGSTNNLEKRVKEHNSSKLGAKYTKTRRPVSLKYFEKVKDRSDAQKRESQIKNLNKRQKAELIKNFKIK